MENQPIGSVMDLRYSSKIFFPSLQGGYNKYLTGLIWLLLCLITLVAYIDGFLIERTGFTRFETIYYVTLLFLLLIWVTLNRIPLLWLAYLLILLVTFWCGTLLNGMDTGRFIDDTRYYLRSYLLGILVFLFFRRTYFDQKSINYFIWLQWFVIVVAVAIHLLLGFGGTHTERGVLRDIYSAFFKEANVVSFFLICLWYYLHCYLYGNFYFIRISVMIVTFITVVLLSSKASMLAMLFLIFYHWITYFKKKSQLRRVVSNLLMFSSITWLIIYFEKFTELLIDLFVIILPDSAQIAYRLNTWDVITVLTSTRNLRILQLFEDIKHFSFSEWLFGIGFNYILEKEKLIESDFFDAFQAFGIIGLFLIYIPWIIALFYIKYDKAIKYSDFRHWVFAMGILYGNLLISTATGHVIMTPMAVILLGIILGRFVNSRMNIKEESR
jgi:hypothetical protein